LAIIRDLFEGQAAVQSFLWAIAHDDASPDKHRQREAALSPSAGWWRAIHAVLAGVGLSCAGNVLCFAESARVDHPPNGPSVMPATIFVS